MDLPSDIYYFYIFPRITAKQDCINLVRVCKYWRSIFSEYLRADPSRINERSLGCLEDVYRSPHVWPHIYRRLMISIWSLHGLNLDVLRNPPLWHDVSELSKFCKPEGNYAFNIRDAYVSMEKSVLHIAILIHMTQGYPHWTCWTIRFWGGIPIVERDLEKALYYRDTSHNDYDWKRFLYLYEWFDPYMKKIINIFSRYQNIDWSMPERLRY